MSLIACVSIVSAHTVRGYPSSINGSWVLATQNDELMLLS
jgi:hypothetical protein